jgi:hypothetical protein
MTARRPSPFSWRIRYALAHKGVPVEFRLVRFADVETIRGLSGQHYPGRVSGIAHSARRTAASPTRARLT